MDQKLPTPEEVQQHRIDTLKIFCPSAIPYITYAQMVGEPIQERLFNWREGFQHVLHMLIHTDRALQSLTPGGSEYVHNPERCVALVKEQQSDLHKSRVRAMRLEKALRGLLEIEDARISSGAFTPNADAVARIDAARAAIQTN